MQKISILLLTLFSFNTLCSCNDYVELASRGKIETPAELKGKLKKVSQFTSEGNKIVTQLSYNEEGKELLGVIISDSLAQSVMKETFIRNADSTLIKVSIERTIKGVKSQGSRQYEYDSNKLLIRTVEEYSDQKIVEEFGYDKDKHLIKYTRSQIQNEWPSPLQSISYKWKGGNVSAIEERGIMGYEETDFIYGSNPNNLGKVFREQIKMPVYLPEQISQNLITFQQKLFEGTRVKYEYEYNRDNRLVLQKSLVDDAVVAELKLEYY